jgi:cation transport protein ChaC
VTLSRRDLELGRMRELYVEASGGGYALDDEALSRSLAATLAAKPRGAGWWIFGYGSLLWNPIFPVAESRVATVHGLHRRFCLTSLASRGTREAPGLVLALESGGAVRGVCHRLPAPLALDELHLLWRREMVVGSYRPRWVRARSGERTIVALAFVMRREHPQYVRLSLDEQARRIATARGAFGSCCDYLMLTRDALARHGVADGYLDDLARRVDAIRPAGP